MPKITLSTGKEVVTRELSAYHQFLLSGFLDIPSSDENGNLTAAYTFKYNMLNAIFSVESVEGKTVEVPTDQKSLIVAFSNFTRDELNELIRIDAGQSVGNGNSEPG